MRKSITLTIAAFSFAVLFAANSAQAQSVSVSGPVSVADTLGNIGNNLDQYQIFLNSDSGANVTAFELTVTGSLAQAQNFSFGNHVPSPLLADVTPFGAGAIAQDSHIVPGLVIPGAPIPPPTEGLITPDVGAPGSGFGSDLMTNPVAVAGPDQAPSVNALQIVLDPGTFAILTGEFAIAGNSDPFVFDEVCIGSCNTSNTPPVVTDLFAGEDWDQETQAFNGTPASYQLQATDAEDGDDDNLSWTLDGFTGPFDAGGNPIAGAGNGNQTVSSTGLFEWDPTGSTNGYYFAAVTVEDSGALTDSGILRVQVPEPSTMLLAGLSLVGVFARRRNS